MTCKLSSRDSNPTSLDLGVNTDDTVRLMTSPMVCIEVEHGVTKRRGHRHRLLEEQYMKAPHDVATVEAIDTHNATVLGVCHFEVEGGL